MDDRDDKEKNLRQIGIFSTIPFVMAVPPILGWFFGTWLDTKLGTTPYFAYVLLFLGFVGGFREVYRIIKRFGNGT